MGDRVTGAPKMVGSRMESQERQTAEKTSLFGLVSFHPRLAIVLMFLTLTVVVVGVRIWMDTGFRRVDALVRDAQRAFTIPQKKGMAARDPAEVEARIREWTGAKVALPRDELFTYTDVSRGRAGRKVAALVHLSYSGERYLLVVRKEMIRGRGSRQFLFLQSGFLSGEKDGNSFVFWEREGVLYLCMTKADLSHAFDLVRRYFT
jgi:hypothetical protein